MDAEYKKLLKGGKWAATGDRADPGSSNISPQLVRATGWPVSYSQADGNTPDRRRMNQQFRELTGGAFEVVMGISPYDDEVDYPIDAITQVTGRLYRAKVANGPTSGTGGVSNATNPINDTNETVWERVSGAVTVPDSPREALFDNSVTNAISLRWKNGRDGGDRIKTYKLQYRTLGTTAWLPDPALSLDYAQHTITGLSSGSVIIVRIKAVTDAGESLDWYITEADAPNNRVTGNVPSGGNALGLTGEAGDARVRLNWSVPTSDGGFPILRYRVQYRTAAESFSADNETTVAAPSTTTLITGLTNDTLYYFRVAAENSQGRGDWSNIAQATPRASVQLAVQPTLLVPSTGRSGSLITASARWSNSSTAPTATPTRAKWQSRLGTGGSWSTSSQTSLTSFTISNATASQVYQVRNLLVTNLGETDWSPIATVPAAINKATAPSAPRNVRVQSGGVSGLPPTWRGTATWSAPSSSGGGVITEYHVRANYSWTSRTVSATLSGSTHLWTLGASNPPTSGGRVTVYVRARNHLGHQSSWSSSSYSL